MGGVTGLAAATYSAEGWNRALQPKLELTRVDASTISVLVPALATYNILLPETVSIVVPPCALRDARRNISASGFEISPLLPLVSLNGSLLRDVTESELRIGGGLSLTVALQEGIYAP